MLRFLVFFIINSLLHSAMASDVVVLDATPEVQSSSTHPSQLNFDFYSETYSTTYFDGLANQSRLRLLHPIYSEKLQAYLGLNTSHDLTQNSSVRFVDSYVSPTAGLLFKPLSFLGLFAEYRRLYRTEKNELVNEENDPRYGIYTYYLFPIPFTFTPHLELYGESVALSRFTANPISTVWLKLGKTFNVTSTLSLTPYAEGYYRESPSTLLGIDETSLRLGGKLKLQWNHFSIQLLGYNRVESSSVPTGWEGFLILAADGKVLPWN